MPRGRKPGEQLERWLTRRCKVCDAKFYTGRSDASFCKSACRQKWYRIMKAAQGDQGNQNDQK